MTPFEIIMAVIALVLLIAVAFMVRLSLRIGRSADEVTRAVSRITELTPMARELIHSSHAEVEALRVLTKNTNGVVSDVRSVSAQASAVTSQLLQGLESEFIDRTRALFEGARAGVGVLRRRRSSNGTKPLLSDHSDEIETPHR